MNCGAKNSPIISHGAHYHRPSCPDYAKPGLIGDTKSLRCEECQRLEQLCLPPKNLVNFDVPPEERLLNP